MKIKGSSSLNISFLPTAMIIAAVLATLLRSIQVFTLIDASTGFYKEKNIITVLFYLVIVASIAVFCVISYISHNSNGINTYEIESKKLSGITVLFAISLLLDALTSFFGGITDNDQLEYVDDSVLKELVNSGSVTDFARGFFALISALYLFMLASSMRNGSDKASKHKIIALAPIGWSAFRLIGLFVSKISFLQVSDLFLELVMLSFMTLFFLAFAQTTSGVYSSSAGWKIPAFGLSSALIAGTLSISRLIATFADRQLYVNENHTFNITDLLFFFFALMLVYEVTRKYNLLFEREEVSENKKAE